MSLTQPLAATVPAEAVVIVMAVAVVIAVLGHMTRLRALIATGILLLFVATAGMLIGGFGAWRDAPGPAPDTLRPTELPPADDSIGNAKDDAQKRVDKTP